MRIRNKLLAAAACAVALCAVSATPAAARQDDIMQHIMGQPSLAWSVYGLQRPVRARPAPEVPGGQAVRIEVGQARANPWDVGAGQPVQGDIHAGDVILLAVWARAEQLPDGQQSASLPMMVTQTAAPYTPVITRNVPVSREWGMVFVKGVAAEDRLNGSAGVSVHLGGAGQTIDLGPAFVFNLGQGYDLSKLPGGE
jgi:hypothetical protein